MRKKDTLKDYTVLIPMMCPIHFELVKNVLIHHGYQVELLTNIGPSVVEEGLKYVHNDTCYPALLVIGQMIDALKSGKYNLDKTALIITQTGGGCRASNYIFLLKKALKKAGLGHIPVLSLNFANLKGESSLKLNLNILRALLAALVYGDLLMDLSNQCKPYEIQKGETMKLVDQWTSSLSNQIQNGHGLTRKEMKEILKEITISFTKIPMEHTPKVKVGIVGEIYIKYSSLGNNDLEKFLASEDCEVKVPGIMGFMLYCVYNMIEDHHLYGGNFLKLQIVKLAYRYALSLEQMIIDAIKENSNFDAPNSFEVLKEEAEKVIHIGTKMGEGWLLTGEMLELNQSGFKNIICTQPFGCLPNHIVGKGMIRKLKEIDPDCNIVSIDYDPSATSVNQENRIKLMLAIAREKLPKR